MITRVSVSKCSSCKKDLIRRFIGIKATNGCEFWISNTGKRLVGKNCYNCKRQKRNVFNRETNFIAYKKYEKTPRGYLMRSYRNILSRVTGIQWKKAHLYKGKEILPRKQFYAWANSNKDFVRLFKTYKKSGFDRKLAPSVNRINSSKGYLLENMEWITHSENSRLGSLSQRNKPRAITVD